MLYYANLPVGAAIGRPQCWPRNVYRFNGNTRNIETFRAPNGRPYNWEDAKIPAAVSLPGIFIRM